MRKSSILSVAVLAFVLCLEVPDSASAQTRMIFADASEDRSIHGIHRNGSDFDTFYDPADLIHDTLAPWIESIVSNASNEKFYWVVWYGGEGFIERANLDGSGREIVLSMDLSSALPIATDLIFDYENSLMYWNSDSGIYQADFDGGNPQPFLANPQTEARGIAASFDDGWIFWIADGVVRRIATDGSGMFVVVPLPGPDPQALEADPVAGRIYWTSLGDNTIKSAQFDGSDYRVMVTGQDSALSLALDPEEGTMYWTRWGPDRIQRANLDGTNVTTIISSPTIPPPMSLAFAFEGDDPGPGVPVPATRPWALGLTAAVVLVLGAVLAYKPRTP